MKACFLPLLFAPLCLLAEGGLPTQPYIYVEGKAEVEKPADMVTLRFEVSAMQSDQGAANKLVQAQANKVFALIKAAEVQDKDVIAADLESEAEYERPDDAERRGKLLGYRVTRPVVVKVRDIKKFPKLVDELLALKVHEFTSISGGLINEQEVEDQVWEKAIANARQRAEKTAAAAGMQIQSVFAMSPVEFPQIHTRIFRGGSIAMYSMDAAPKIEPSQYRLVPVSISQSVHVIFLIAPAK